MNTEPNSLMLALQSEILEAIATGRPFEEIADLLCRRAESLAPGVHCSILRVDSKGLLHPVAAPSLPQHYSDALNNLAIGPMVGSCGSAAYYGVPVEVTDISTDPLWVPYAPLALPIGLMACWSSPIKAGGGQVVATFAFYYRTKRGPSEMERLIVGTCVHLCAIAIENSEARHRSRYLAYNDQLTDLPNRRCFDEMISSRILNDAPAFGLLLVDIDNLKVVNDTMGHLVGDRLIVEVANRLRQMEPAVSTSRHGGDEFALLVDGCNDHAALGAFAAQIVNSMKQPFQSNGNMIIPQVTIGGIVYGVDGTDADALRQNADFALYHAKETNRGGYVPFKPGLRTSITRRIATIQQVDQALSADSIVPYYQPIVALDTAEIVGIEALARMRTGDGRIVSAMSFQAALSDPKVAYRLTDRMLAQAAHDVRRWIDDGIPFQHVGINLSTVDFQRNDLERRLTQPFEAEGVPLKHLLLEVTESIFMDGADNDAAKAIERLRNNGMLVALDDFGTGYASLTHLLTFPVDIIKIDKSFIDRLLTDRSSRVIVEALIDIARKLGMRIVAEGIENAAQAERLREMGCMVGQGYHFARPADAATTTHLLRVNAQKEPISKKSGLRARAKHSRAFGAAASARLAAGE